MKFSKRIAGKLFLAVALVPFLLFMGCCLIGYYIETWRFFRSAKRYLTYHNGEEWVTVEE